MNYRIALGALFLVGLVGCAPASQNASTAIESSPSPAVSSPVAEASAAASVAPVVAPSAIASPAPQRSLAEVSRITKAGSVSIGSPSPAAPPAQPETTASDPVQRDYSWTTPIPATGRVTVRQDIRSLDPAQLITTCPADSGPYAFAESTHYYIQVCSKEYDPWLPKYYIGKAKDGSGELRITSSNINEAKQLIFKNDDYTYILYRDGVRPDTSNAYLEVYTPDGKGYGEALLYLYTNDKPPQ